MSLRHSIFVLSLAAVLLSLTAVIVSVAIILFLLFESSEEPQRVLVQAPTPVASTATSVPPTVVRRVLPTAVPQTATPFPATASIEPVMVRGMEPVMPFTNIAREVLGENAFLNNWHPGSAFFDFDRDGDMDFYVTQANADSKLQEAPGGPNLLFRNDGNNVFTEVGEELGADLSLSNSTAVAACDFDNDGYQDLYVAGYGLIGDELDYRSAVGNPTLTNAIKDRILRNVDGDRFEEITDTAFGDDINVQSAITIACGDVNNDGWTDVFVGNRLDQDFIRFDDPRHHGHYNRLYINNGDLTFRDVTESAGLISPPIKMLSPEGEPMQWKDPATGESVQGYDASLQDANGNRIGDPTGQTLASLFFDHDSDGDLDLWLADDGDTLKVYRNDSDGDDISFTSVESAMGVDSVGAWMGFALGDYDSDEDLDIFITNIGYHFLLYDVPPVPSGDCAYSHAYGWGTCYHFLLRNDGVKEDAEVGMIGDFTNVAPQTDVATSLAFPPESLDQANILEVWNDVEQPVGLAAYDFGFGTAFFDYENDGDQDLYWLGAMGGRGEGPNGFKYTGSGRMLRGDGEGQFEDITVEARLLDIQGVNYNIVDPNNPDFDPERQRLDRRYHENGKGLAKCDLNGDGTVDLLGTNSNGPVFIGENTIDFFRGPLFLWMSNASEGSWLSVKLTGRQSIDGTGSNADGIGARVKVTADVDGSGELTTQVQDVLGSSSFLSMNCIDLHFGLGQASKVEKIEVTWPSGVVQVSEAVAVNQSVEIVEVAK